MVNDNLRAPAKGGGINKTVNSPMALRASKRRTSAPAGRRRPGRPAAASLVESLRQKRATADKIATRLEEDIVLGRRHPRERLVEQDLCDRFNTHRADVRLALFELEKKGIVQRIPNRGAIVRDLTPREVMDIYAVREELEVMAARILPFPVGATELAKLDHLHHAHPMPLHHDDLRTLFYPR